LAIARLKAANKLYKTVTTEVIVNRLLNHKSSERKAKYY